MEAATKSPQTEPTARGKRALDRELYCPRLERLLFDAASELGLRGNLSSTIASIERGGAGGGSNEDPNLAMLRRLGATDRSWITGKASHLRTLERQWALLSREHQATALAHYLGTPRTHGTFKERFGCGQGGLAGVVFYRWQNRQAKGRQRTLAAPTAQLTARLEGVRAELAPIDAELKALRGLSRAAAPIPYLPKPQSTKRAPLSAEELAELLSVYHATVAAHRAVARFLAALRSVDIDRQIGALNAQRRPLLAEQAQLCADLAKAVEMVADGQDDEQALLLLCRSGTLNSESHLSQAEADVRALHRAWYAAGKATAKSAATEWVDGASPA